MNTAKIINVSNENIPQEYYNKTYAYFSFDVMDGRAIALHLIDGADEPSIFLVIDLRGLTPGGREKFREFLRSITVSDKNHLGLDLDRNFARKKFGITIRVK